MGWQTNSNITSDMCVTHVYLVFAQAKGLTNGEDYSRNSVPVRSLKHNAGLALFLLANWPKYDLDGGTQPENVD